MNARLIFVLMSLLLGVGVAAKANNDICKKALEIGAVGKFEEARSFLKKTVSQADICTEAKGGLEVLSDLTQNDVAPDVAMIMFRALMYEHDGNLEGMLTETSKAIKKDPDYAPAYSLRGSAYGLLGESTKAVRDFTQSLKIEPDNSIAYNARGLAYKAIGKMESAMSDFRKAVELGYTEAYGGIGSVYGMKQDYEQAFFYYNEALKHHPSNADALSGRAFLYAAKKDYDNAVKDINKAIAIDSGNPEIWFMKGAINVMQGHKKEAIKDFRQFLSIALPMHQRAVDYARNYIEKNNGR